MEYVSQATVNRWVLVEIIDAFEIHNRAPMSGIYAEK